MSDGERPVTREDIERLSSEGKSAMKFMAHVDSLQRFLAAASGCPQVRLTEDDCCAQCGAPERTFRAWLRVLAYSEKQ